MGCRVGKSPLGGFSKCAKIKKTWSRAILCYTKSTPSRQREKADGSLPSLSRNRSGLKVLGPSQMSWSWCIDHRLVNSVVPLGILYPHRVVSTVVLWVYLIIRYEMRKVSVVMSMMASTMSLRSGKQSGPITLFGSWCTSQWKPGLWIRYSSAQHRVLSKPATKTSRALVFAMIFTSVSPESFDGRVFFSCLFRPLSLSSTACLSDLEDWQLYWPPHVVDKYRQTACLVLCISLSVSG